MNWESLRLWITNPPRLLADNLRFCILGFAIITAVSIYSCSTRYSARSSEYAFDHWKGNLKRIEKVELPELKTTGDKEVKLTDSQRILRNRLIKVADVNQRSFEDELYIAIEGRVVSEERRLGLAPTP